MVNLDILAKRGITVEKLKGLFTSENPTDKIVALTRRLRSRVQDGLANNFSTYKLLHALDQAWDTPFKQITPTLIAAIASREPTEDTYKIAQQWGLAYLMVDEIDEKTKKPTGKKKFNLPTFFNVFVPLVRAYVLIRAAKLTTDRNLVPHFKFEPLQSTPINRARCEIISDRIEAMTTQMGLRDATRQSILKMLIYPYQLQFISEEWFTEEQEDAEGNKYIVREGLRYTHPHPSRSYVDAAHPLSSIHSDTGVEFMGYWRVRRYREVKQTAGLWNTDRIAFNNSDYRVDHPIFFQTVYASCTLAFPQSIPKWGELDREKNFAERFYTSDFDDSAIVLTEHFERIIPADDGLGDYKYPVWFRFVMAGDGTVCYAAPLPSIPTIYWGYDPDEGRSVNPSLALEVLPFQDQISNLLTQTLLSVKQNLANATFVDTDIVDEESVKQIENAGESWFRKLNFIRFSGRKSRTAQQDVRFAFGSVRFPQLDTAATIQVINTVLNILERVLVISAQEIAGQASHEQSAEEVRNIQQASSIRVAYTSMGVDRSWDALKRQLYAYTMAYSEPEIYAQLSGNPDFTPKVLEDLGFTVEHPAVGEAKALVKGHKKTLQLEYFASTRDGSDRTNNAQLANNMVQILTMALGNPMMGQVIGPVQAITLMNHVLEQMGLPRDFKLRPMPPEMPPDKMQEWVQQQLLNLTTQVKKFVEQGQQLILEKVGEGLKPLAQAAQEALAEGRDNKLAIAKIAEILAHPHPATYNDPGSTLPPGGTGNPGNPPMVTASGMPVG